MKKFEMELLKTIKNPKCHTIHEARNRLQKIKQYQQNELGDLLHATVILSLFTIFFFIFLANLLIAIFTLAGMGEIFVLLCFSLTFFAPGLIGPIRIFRCIVKLRCVKKVIAKIDE